jgi:hypothetical protein
MLGSAMQAHTVWYERNTSDVPSLKPAALAVHVIFPWSSAVHVGEPTNLPSLLALAGAVTTNAASTVMNSNTFFMLHPLR